MSYSVIFHVYINFFSHMMQEAPSVLEQPEASLRDPAFYQIWKRIQHLFNKYQNRLPPYTRDNVSTLIIVKTIIKTV